VRVALEAAGGLAEDVDDPVRGGVAGDGLVLEAGLGTLELAAERGDQKVDLGGEVAVERVPSATSACSATPRIWTASNPPWAARVIVASRIRLRRSRCAADPRSSTASELVVVVTVLTLLPVWSSSAAEFTPTTASVTPTGNDCDEERVGSMFRLSTPEP